MPDTPLNPDALEAGAKAMYETRSLPGDWIWEELRGDQEFYRDIAQSAVSAYLAVAQPEDMLGTYTMGTEEEALKSHERREAMKAQPEVNSKEELDALPPESYVQGWDGFKHAKTRSGDWVLCVEHTRGSHNSESVELPARVLYRPTEEKP